MSRRERRFTALQALSLLEQYDEENTDSKNEALTAELQQQLNSDEESE